MVSVLATYPDAGSYALQAAPEMVTVTDGGAPGGDGPITKPQVRVPTPRMPRSALFYVSLLALSVPSNRTPGNTIRRRRCTAW